MLDKCMEHLSSEITLIDGKKKSFVMWYTTTLTNCISICIPIDDLPIYEDEAYMKKYFASSNLTEDSSNDDQLLEDQDLEKSLSENETENNASGLDVEMDLSPWWRWLFLY